MQANRHAGRLQALRMSALYPGLPRIPRDWLCTAGWLWGVRVAVLREAPPACLQGAAKDGFT